jgi:uncharacterized protein YqhQ
MSKKLKIREATSFYDGIEFYSRRNKGCIAKVTLAKDGTINTLYGKKEEITSEEKNSPVKRLLILIAIIAVSVALTFALYGLTSLLGLDEIKQAGIMLFSVAIFILITIVAKYVKERRTTEGRSSLLYHSAEHMAANAMKSLQRVPTLEEIKQFSRFSTFCSTNEPFYYAFLLLIISCSMLLLQGTAYTVISLMGTSLILLLRMSGGLNFTQYLSTLPPSDIELKVAISGIQVWYDHETEK